MYESKNSVYCYKGTNVLVNKMNIKDPIALKNYETSVIGLKLMALSKQGITGKFDVSHFVSIHKFLFEDIYPFAGLFRTENIAKDYFQFAEWEYIENELTRLLSELKSENFLDNLTKEKFKIEFHMDCNFDDQLSQISNMFIELRYHFEAEASKEIIVGFIVAFNSSILHFTGSYK